MATKKIDAADFRKLKKKKKENIMQSQEFRALAAAKDKPIKVNGKRSNWESHWQEVSDLCYLEKQR